MARAPLRWQNVASTARGGPSNAGSQFTQAGRLFMDVGDNIRDRNTDSALRDLLSDGEITTQEVAGVQGNVDIGDLLKTQQDVTNANELTRQRGILARKYEADADKAEFEASPEYLEREEQRKIDEAERAATQLTITQQREQRLQAEADREQKELERAEEARGFLSTRSEELLAPMLTEIGEQYELAFQQQRSAIESEMLTPGMTEDDKKRVQPFIDERIKAAEAEINQERRVAEHNARTLAGARAYGEFSTQYPVLSTGFKDTQQGRDYAAGRDAANQVDVLNRAGAEADQKAMNTLLKSSGKTASSAAVTINANGQPSLVSDEFAKANNNTSPENVTALANRHGIDPDDKDFKELVELSRGNLSAVEYALTDTKEEFELFWFDDYEIDKMDKAREKVRRAAAIAEGYAEDMRKANKTVAPRERQNVLDSARNNWADEDFRRRRIGEITQQEETDKAAENAAAQIAAARKTSQQPPYQQGRIK